MFKTRFLLISLLAVAIFFAGCKKDEEDPVNESEVLATFLESTNSPSGKDYVNTDMPSIISATEVYTLNTTGQIYIIDIRAEADFNAGHIENANLVALGDILNHIQSVDLTGYDKVAIVCYTGQSAGFATSLLRLMGYGNVFSMKWGMCSWHEDFAGKWNSNISNMYASQFTSDVSDKNQPGGMPVLNTGKTTGQEILEARVAVLLSEGYGNGVAAVANQTVFSNLDDYYIVNYWPESQYLDPGHIPGAIQYTPKQSMKMNEYLNTLPTDKPVVAYCYTGQTSSFLAAYLRLLGYDAKSLLYGANGMIYDIMETSGMTIFDESQIMGYEYE
jgi:rhodanese-related sulfurtransferase